MGVTPVMKTSIPRHLRSNLTDAEKRLWSKIRNKQIEGHRFRRQAPIGPYVVDFFCPKRKLVIELDGGQHATQMEADAERTAWLETKGYRVIRFWNNEVFENLDGVLQSIIETLKG